MTSIDYAIGDHVMIEYTGTGPARAEIMAFNALRPNVVKVKYLHSRTAAWVARDRILGWAEPRSQLGQIAAGLDVGMYEQPSPPGSAPWESE